MIIIKVIILFVFGILNAQEFKNFGENIEGNYNIIQVFKRGDGLGYGSIISFENRELMDSITELIIRQQRELIMKSESKASLCNNLDFEIGDFTNWTGQVGVNNGYPAGGWGGGITNNRHTIETGGTDPHCGFSKLAPGGGSFSVRLGNDINGAEAERLIFSFYVQPIDTNFIYKYAVVFEDPGHSWDEQPYFEMKILDQNGHIIPCGHQHYTAAPNIPGFYNGTGGVGVRCKDWTTVGINLSNYVGQVVTIIATTADCSLGGHFGYAYLDFLCPSHFTQAVQPFCSNQTSVTLDPQIQIDAVFHWSTGHTTPTITINPNDYAGDTILLYAEQPQSLGLCGFWYLFPINVINPIVDFNYNVQCLTVNFNDQSYLEYGEIYSWHWNFGDGNTSNLQNPTHTYQNDGTYNVTLTINTYCGEHSITKTITLKKLTASYTKADVSCYGFSNGEVSVIPDGTSPYSYTWNTEPPNYTSTISNVPAGIYTVTISDAIGCSTTLSVEVTQPTELQLTMEVEDVKCYGGSDGIATVMVTGGTPPYEYVWNTNPPQYSSSAMNLPYGTYTVTVIDANGCTKFMNAYIAQPTALSSFTVGMEPLCYGGSDGWAYVSVSGGVPPYTYLWSTTPIQTTDTCKNIPTGTYFVTVTDYNDCVLIDSITITQPPKLLIDSIIYIEPLCFGGNDGSATVYASGGTPPYIYNWSTIPIQTSQTATSLSSTFYYVTVYDSHYCSEVDTIYITQPTEIQATTSKNDVLCYGDNTGSAQVFPFGGTPPYTFLWNTNPQQSESEAVFLPAGEYTVTITDMNGCTKTYTFNITQPPELTTQIIKKDQPCYLDTLGEIDLIVSGGVQPYFYVWSNGNTSEDLYNLAAGVYVVTVKDSHNCTKVDGVEITQPPKLQVEISPPQYICYGKHAYLNMIATGGTPPYTFMWDGIPLSSSIIVYPDTTTIYTGYVIDANGCKTDTVFTIVYVSPPLQVNLILNKDSVCPNETVMLTPIITGGVGPPYIIYDLNGEIVIPPVFVKPNQSGYYGIYVEDACGTYDSGMVYIFVYDIPKPQIVADTTQGCAPLVVHFNEMSPNEGLSYLWDFGDKTDLSLAKNPIHTYEESGVFDITIVVTSPEGCKGTFIYKEFIKVWPKPYVAFEYEPKEASILNPEIQFINKSTNVVTNMWFFGDGDSSSAINPKHLFNKPGEYEVWLIGMSDKGCLDTAKAKLIISDIFTFYAPTAFSPDFDKINDYFFIIAHGIKEEGFKLEIYDRWGEKVWETNKFYSDLQRSEKWNGKIKNGEIAPVGTYTWRALFKDYKNIYHEKTGKVTIIR